MHPIWFSPPLALDQPTSACVDALRAHLSEASSSSSHGIDRFLTSFHLTNPSLELP
uniref:Uncharacterized protein n=4 Tax=Oryza TaxID=4527 RepID=A0A1V1GZQ8_ORYSJ|nr:hypothetical protein [Oryza sativa Japonica Group]BAD69430.1 hypothetical protein [Oryza sativa Japonica Group]BAX24589.1 hypothetical protein [Oryza sativa Japonica Group]BAX24606.1 hypothetical protein [Oryza sativa Indica Group]BAX24702.1 hypothetical protein [Oryza rufipogon]